MLLVYWLFFSYKNERNFAAVKHCILIISFKINLRMVQFEYWKHMGNAAQSEIKPGESRAFLLVYLKWHWYIGVFV